MEFLIASVPVTQLNSTDEEWPNLTEYWEIYLKTHFLPSYTEATFESDGNLQGLE